MATTNPFFAHFYKDAGKKESSSATAASSPHEDLLRRVLDSPNGGLESTNFHEARSVVSAILKQRWEVEQQDANSPLPSGGGLRRRRPKIILAYTSNLISCGLRELFAYLARLELVDAFVSTAGGIEEDVIKCLGDTLVGDFALPGAALRDQGLNRVGNLLIPNDNYVSFEEFFVPVIERLHRKQLQCNYQAHTSPTEVNYEMGLELGSDNARQYLFSPTLHHRRKQEEQGPKVTTAFASSSVQAAAAAETAIVATPEEEAERTACLERSLVYWCSKRRIPLYCPALTDGSMGDMMCFYEWQNKGFTVDPMADYGWLIPFGNEEEEEENAATSSTEEEEQDVLVLCLGAGLPRNYALNMTPTTGMRFHNDYAEASASHVESAGHKYDVNDGASPLPYPSFSTNIRDAKTDGNNVVISRRACKINRTIVQIVTGSANDQCRSSVVRESDLETNLVSEADRFIRVQGDASLLFPLLLAGVLPTTTATMA